MKKRRCFIALSIPDSIQDYLETAIAQLKYIYSSLGYVKADDIHLTLNFLGYVDERTIAEVKDILKNVARNFSPMELAMGDFGCFPDWRAPCVLFLNVQETGIPRLVQLQKTLSDTLIARCIEFDNKPWYPHLTIARVHPPKFSEGKLGRIAFDEKKLRSIRACHNLRFTVHSIELMESHLSRASARYEILHSTLFNNK